MYHIHSVYTMYSLKKLLCNLTFIFISISILSVFFVSRYNLQTALITGL